MNSRPSRACSSRLPLGVDSTGLPATVTSARTCPSPSPRISSANAATGSSPPYSGSPETRLRQRPKWPPEVLATRSRAGEVHSAPPTRSRLPVTRLISCTSHWQSVPKAWVETPIRP
ncbi:Uncharacterised protein [Acinetobacter baumannii]|nr:Uncharacterised protein [Acinetobacter baumannii]